MFERPRLGQVVVVRMLTVIWKTKIESTTMSTKTKNILKGKGC